MNFDSHHLHPDNIQMGNLNSVQINHQHDQSPLTEALMPPVPGAPDAEAEAAIDSVYTLLSKCVRGCCYMELLRAVAQDAIPVGQGSFVPKVTWEMVRRIPELYDTYQGLRAKEAWPETVASWFGGKLASNDFLSRHEPLADAVKELMQAGLVTLEHQTNVVGAMMSGVAFPVVYWSIGVSERGRSALSLLTDAA